LIGSRWFLSKLMFFSSFCSSRARPKSAIFT
jgi:hypothetical protein